MRGRLIDLTVGLNGKQRLAIELDTDFRDRYDRFSGADVNLDIKKWRKPCSNDANAYACINRRIMA